MKVEASEKRKAKVKKKKEVEVNVKVKEKGLIFGLSEKQILIFLLEFLAVAAVTLGVWYYIGEFYQAAVFFVAKHILLLMGYTPLQISAINLGNVYLLNLNLVPLVALAIATPKLAVRKRLEMLAIGIPILFLLHVLDIVVHLPYFIELYYLQSPGFATLVMNSLGVVGLAAVFIIWLAICYDN